MGRFPPGPGTWACATQSTEPGPPGPHDLRAGRCAEAGVRHIKTYGTAWGGYVLLEVEDADAFARYQLHHAMSYGHMADITFEPIFDLDAALAPRIAEIKR